MNSNAPAQPHTSPRNPAPALARALVPVGWLVLMASPVAAANNASVLILDDIGTALGTSAATASWLATVFALVLAVATPLQAALMRHRGRRTVLFTSAALVTAGTFLLLVSPWLPLAVAGRAIQAAGGAGLNVLAITLAGSARRIGAISAGMGLFGAVSPLIGTQLTEALSWRVALSMLAITLITVPVVSRRIAPGTAGTDRFDTWGALLVAVLSGSVVMVASNPLPALAATVISILLLVLHTRRRSDGYVPVATIRSGRFPSATGLTLALSAGYFTLLFVIPQLLIARAHWTKDAAATGQLVAMVLASLATLAFTSIAARLSRTTVRVVLVAAGGTAVLAALFASAPVLLLAGIFLALFAATSANATQVIVATASVPEQHKPTAIGLFTLLYLLGGAIGPALASALVLS
ncbi:MFS transporter [[Kitasatospora] papulosa]|uniref:MFS transporter n=1 Tax=Streptomyces TaxID=1883 RepID=UPI0004C63725|nr:MULTISPECIES: MFS transporter [Streptomyces]MDX3186599.1 MFS transporter [Streptomyces sp. ME02-7008A-1]MDX3307379.1 MFS transporter [Streptomyces sp. ME02-7008A]WSZ45850.1 MFS transporter [[Kitasatospora] papulosa]